MAELDKDLLRKLAAALLEIKEEEDHDAFDDWQEATHPWKILPILDENAAQAARIAELERECERLREDYDKEWRRSETNAQNCVALSAELEACGKDAHRAHVCVAKMATALMTLKSNGQLTDMQASVVDQLIDAAMQEGGE